MGLSNYTLPAIDALPMIKRPHEGLFGSGNVGGILGGIAKLLAYGPFAGEVNHSQNIGQDRLDQEDHTNAINDQIRQAQLAAIQSKPVSQYQPVNLGNGGFGSFNPETGALNMLHEGAPKDERSAAARAFADFQALPPDQQKVARPFFTGMQYTPEGMAMREQYAGDVANIQGQARAKYRAPTAGRMSPFGRTKSNPMPIKSEADLAGVTAGTWVSPHPGVVFQVR